VQKFKIKSYCKINLSLKVIRKLNDGYHSIISLITFCNLHDLITISKIKSFNDKISFSGKFKNGINTKSNTITKMLKLLRKDNLIKKQSFKINIKKNIPHGSGLGGGSANSADILNFLNLRMRLNLNKNNLEKIARKIGFDVPISLEKKNTFITGKKNEIIRLKENFNLILLIVYPNLICSTKKIYKKIKIINRIKKKRYLPIKNRKNLINFLNKENNDLERPVVKTYPQVENLIHDIAKKKGCYLSRITGSGSACIGIFSNMKSAIYAKKLVKIKYPKYWSIVSKTI